MVANLFFILTTSLPKYSFSPAKFRFQRLVSEKNNFLIIPNRVIRDALNYKRFFCLGLRRKKQLYKEYCEKWNLISLKINSSTNNLNRVKMCWNFEYLSPSFLALISAEMNEVEVYFSNFTNKCVVNYISFCDFWK